MFLKFVRKTKTISLTEAGPDPEAVVPKVATKEADKLPSPIGAPVTLTTHLQGHVDCTGSSGRLLGRALTGTTAHGETTSPPGQETIETSLPQLK